MALDEPASAAGDRDLGIRGESTRSDRNLNWQRVIDHIGAEMRILLVRLETLVRPLRAREQRIATGLR